MRRLAFSGRMWYNLINEHYRICYRIQFIIKLSSYFHEWHSTAMTGLALTDISHNSLSPWRNKPPTRYKFQLRNTIISGRRSEIQSNLYRKPSSWRFISCYTARPCIWLRSSSLSDVLNQDVSSNLSACISDCFVVDWVNGSFQHTTG